jgi:hypothetical protein
VDSGVGTLAYTARSDGRVWLYDKDDRTVLDSRHIQHGQEYRVIPDQNRVDAGRSQGLRKGHQAQASAPDLLPIHRTTAAATAAARGASDVPHSATRVASGTGELTYRTKNSGHIYVVDEDVNRIVYDHSVREDQEIVVRPDDDRIAVDGRNVFNGNLEHKHSHRIYFDRE